MESTKNTDTNLVSRVEVKEGLVTQVTMFDRAEGFNQESYLTSVTGMLGGHRLRIHRLAWANRGEAESKIVGFLDEKRLAEDEARKYYSEYFKAEEQRPVSPTAWDPEAHEEARNPNAYFEEVLNKPQTAK